jgi:hypothetical protein
VTLTSWPVSTAWGALYTAYYLAFATHAWMFLLLPVRWFEVDPGYQIMRVLAALGVIDMSQAQKAR